jgi:glycine/D-amino acid oxidase-like deaminating enzyme
VRDEVPIVRARIGPIAAAPGPLRAVQIGDGRELRADAFVFACGAWLPKVFPSLLEGRIRPTRQVVLYFGTPAGDERFGPQHTPAWVDFPSGVYGAPDLEGRGVKVGLDRHGDAFDPDTGDRTVDLASVAIARAWLARRFPAMAGAPLVESRVCQYENTSTGDFLIDRHPDHENVWIVGGGSGHGFKHGPAVGEHVAGLISKGEDLEPRFSLQARTEDARRSVH